MQRLELAYAHLISKLFMLDRKSISVNEEPLFKAVYILLMSCKVKVKKKRQEEREEEGEREIKNRSKRKVATEWWREKK